ncbi:GpE family phage tail protein [Fodinicurvata sp. EGI_FJ10296]
MADIAAVFHWPLADLERLEVSELAFWHDKAVKRYQAMSQTKEPRHV